MTPPRRKRRSQRTELRTVLLVTNGRVTENAYLQQLCRRVDRDRVSAKVKVINGDPLTVVKELSGPRSDLSDYREVWIVVDHDGRERHDFLKECRIIEQQPDRCPWHRLRALLRGLAQRPLRPREELPEPGGRSGSLPGVDGAQQEERQGAP